MIQTVEGIHSLADLKTRSNQKEDWYLTNTGDRMEEVLEKWQGERFKGDWRILTGARVLDLGCGTAWPESCHVYPPNFCQIAAANGATVFGVDRFPALPEDTLIFNHIQIDFVRAVATGKLKRLFPIQNTPFNIIHFWRVDTDPFMGDSLNRYGLCLDEFRRLFFLQARDLLSEGGLLASEYTFLRREKDDFTEV